MNRQKEPWRLALAIREPYLSHFVLIFVSFLVENFTDQVLCYKKGSRGKTQIPQKKNPRKGGPYTKLHMKLKQSHYQRFHLSAGDEELDG